MRENKLPLKYRDHDGKGYCDALMPSKCRYGSDTKGLFQCLTGEIVKVKWMGTMRNSKKECEDDLQKLSQKLYGLNFSYVRSIWYGRINCFEDTWDWIRMYKVEK